jgi:aspartate/methionine/tyrosine aminotransferase
MTIMEVDKFVKKELLTAGAGSMTRSMPPMPPNAINLLAGDPDFNQPEFIAKAVYDAMIDGYTHYAFGGDPAFKAAIANYYGKYGVDVDPAKQVLVAPGSVYGPKGEGHVRLALVKPVDVLEEAVDRLGKYFSGLKV